ncbi:MAG: ComEC/Rec2 family competence protein [Patescibacteria group bacterium]|nr:ComEC/Rec2 family competence protein [Patescibacteria group bacterium]
MRGTYVFWSVFVAAAICRVAFSLHQNAPPADDCLKQIVTGYGAVSEDPSMNSTGQILVIAADRLTVASTSIQCAAGLNVRVKAKSYPRFAYGDEVSFTGKLNVPFNFSSGDNGRTFDYKGYLAKDDVFYEMKSAVVEKTELPDGMKSESHRLAADTGDLITGTLYALKHRFDVNLESTLGEPHAALAEGLVVGEKAALGSDLLNDFRIVGLIHIVVLSGFNITVVAVAMRRVLSFLPRVWGIVIGGIGIALFGVLVGGGATVVRSCFMGIIALVADLIRRDYSVHRALAFAALLMLIANPMVLLHDPSFQLSFLATIGLILLAGPIESRLGFIPEKFGMRGTVAATFSTQIFVSPYILYMMGQISIIGVVVNILVLPFIPVTMLAVFLTGAVGFVLPVVAQIIGWAAHFLLSYELFMVEWFARVPYAAAYVPPFSIWWVAGFYGVVVTVYVYLKKEKVTKKATVSQNASLL